VLFKNIAYFGSFKHFVFVFFYKWTQDMSQRTLKSIFIYTGTLESLASSSLYVSLCVSLCMYFSLSLSYLESVDSMRHQLSENIWFNRLDYCTSPPEQTAIDCET